MVLNSQPFVACALAPAGCQQSVNAAKKKKIVVQAGNLQSTSKAPLRTSSGNQSGHSDQPTGTGVTVFDGREQHLHHCTVLCGPCRRRYTHTHTRQSNMKKKLLQQDARLELPQRRSPHVAFKVHQSVTQLSGFRFGFGLNPTQRLRFGLEKAQVAL